MRAVSLGVLHNEEVYNTGDASDSDDDGDYHYRSGSGRGDRRGKRRKITTTNPTANGRPSSTTYLTNIVQDRLNDGGGGASDEGFDDVGGVVVDGGGTAVNGDGTDAGSGNAGYELSDEDLISF